MGISPVILNLHLIVWSLLFIACQTVKNHNETVPTEGGQIVIPMNHTSHMIKTHNNETQPDAKHFIEVNHTEHHVNMVTHLPPYEVGQKNDNKTSVPKKNAVLTTNTTTGTTSTTTTTSAVPHKPTKTIGEDEETSSSNTKSQSNDTQKHGISIESVTQKSKKTDYVVPIVAVIMSVPLVAIIFSVLYKRGADWWQHRHYRRMDFLIEGMYNN